MTAHTKGPWRFIDVIGGCSVYAGSRQVLRYPYSPDKENRANARLVSTAPELLAALKEMYEAFKYCYESDGQAEAVAIALDVIIKAEGSHA